MLHASPLGVFLTSSLYPQYQVVGVDLIINNAPTVVHIHDHFPLFVALRKRNIMRPCISHLPPNHIVRAELMKNLILTITVRGS